MHTRFKRTGTLACAELHCALYADFMHEKEKRECANVSMTTWQRRKWNNISKHVLLWSVLYKLVQENYDASFSLEDFIVTKLLSLTAAPVSTAVADEMPLAAMLRTDCPAELWNTAAATFDEIEEDESRW